MKEKIKNMISILRKGIAVLGMLDRIMTEENYIPTLYSENDRGKLALAALILDEGDICQDTLKELLALLSDRVIQYKDRGSVTVKKQETEKNGTVTGEADLKLGTFLVGTVEFALYTDGSCQFDADSGSAAADFLSCHEKEIVEDLLRQVA